MMRRPGPLALLFLGCQPLVLKSLGPPVLKSLEPVLLKSISQEKNDQ
jgi:hypothetical protein